MPPAKVWGSGTKGVGVIAMPVPCHARVHSPLWPIHAGSDSLQNLAAMQRQQKSLSGKCDRPALSGSSCIDGDYHCAHSVVIDTGPWADYVHLSDWSRNSPVRFAGIAAPIPGHCLSRRAWARDETALARGWGCARAVPCAPIRVHRIFLPGQDGKTVRRRALTLVLRNGLPLDGNLLPFAIFS